MQQRGTDTTSGTTQSSARWPAGVSNTTRLQRKEVGIFTISGLDDTSLYVINIPSVFKYLLAEDEKEPWKSPEGVV